MDVHSQTNGVHIDGVTKRFGRLEAVRDVTLEIGSGEFFSLLGPSGCGKTTLLRIVAGFEQPDEGRVRIAGRDVTETAPQKRPTAMVFQNYALFPNMSVGENVAYGLKVRKVAADNRMRRVLEALRRVGMEELREKPVDQLSGGQQQRVAVARAIAVEPDVLLFDEPLSNLDVALREKTRAELKSIQRQLGRTSIYVTHDQQEALVLSDRIGVMRSGRLVEVGTPEELFANPQTAFVATFLGGCNLIDNRDLAKRLIGIEPPTGKVLAVRPDELEIRLDQERGIEARAVSRHFLGLRSEWHLEVGNISLRATTPPDLPFTQTVFLHAPRYRFVTSD
jgi:ABC-type Fe3+/spermidine/putrescine transport system ATPase subunit